MVRQVGQAVQREWHVWGSDSRAEAVKAGSSCADDAAYFERSRTVYLPFTASRQKPRRLTWAQEVSRMLFEGQVGK